MSNEPLLFINQCTRTPVPGNLTHLRLIHFIIGMSRGPRAMSLGRPLLVNGRLVRGCGVLPWVACVPQIRRLSKYESDRDNLNHANCISNQRATVRGPCGGSEAGHTVIATRCRVRLTRSAGQTDRSVCQIRGLRAMIHGTDPGTRAKTLQDRQGEAIGPGPRVGGRGKIRSSLRDYMRFSRPGQNLPKGHRVITIFLQMNPVP